MGEEAVCHPPWAAMLSSRAVWAIIIAHFTENWGFYSEYRNTCYHLGSTPLSALLTSLPLYMRDVLQYPLDEAGLLAAVPYVLMAVVVQLAGYLADTIRADGKVSTSPHLSCPVQAALCAGVDHPD